MLTVFVPAPDSDLCDHVDRGAGIVGSRVGEQESRLRIDFEGDDTLFPTYAARVRRASERHTWTGAGGKKGYPTRACAYVNDEEVIAVGRYDTDQRRIRVHDEETLTDWLKVESLERVELTSD